MNCICGHGEDEHEGEVGACEHETDDDGACRCAMFEDDEVFEEDEDSEGEIV